MSAEPELYLGLISGTSADAIDVALASFEPIPRLHACLAFPYPSELRARVIALARERAHLNLDDLGVLDTALGKAFAEAAIALLQSANTPRSAIRALGSHGQTVRHRPFGEHPFTLQTADPNVIAELTGITTVADFRRRDVAAGGQGAPLLPAFHHTLLAKQGSARVVLNLGGIANITVLPADNIHPVMGCDTGPANCLMDAWATRHLQQPRDDNGVWARQGRVDPALLQRLLSESYFAAPAPKSSGRELFNIDWLERQLEGLTPKAVDVQATLLALTVRSIADAIARFAPDTREVLLCGGGVHNTALFQSLEAALAPRAVASTAMHGVDPDFVEAMAFAWLAYRRLRGLPGNLVSVTGASGPRVLGAVYFGSAETGLS
ncbi:MAG: anhydro-N-acetylmuramic acid kinase [Tahibacter sp.]